MAANVAKICVTTVTMLAQFSHFQNWKNTNLVVWQGKIEISLHRKRLKSRSLKASRWSGWNVTSRLMIERCFAIGSCCKPYLLHPLSGLAEFVAPCNCLQSGRMPMRDRCVIIRDSGNDSMPATETASKISLKTGSSCAPWFSCQFIALFSDNSDYSSVHCTLYYL